MRTPTRFLSLCLAAALGLAAFASAAAEGGASASKSGPDAKRDVDYWLDRMGEALRTENYEGIFTYMRGHQFDTIEVVHRFNDGMEVERLLHLNGEQREIMRHGDEIVCRHGNTERPDLNHEVPLGPFTHAFNENLSNYQSFYDIELLGADRVAGREAVKLAITPRHDDRWGYRLWLDEASGLLLQSHLVGRGRVLEVFQFSRVDIGETIADEELRTALEGEVAEHRLAPAENESAEPAATKPQFRVAWLPNGFRQVQSRRPDRIVFTDGIATFSVFVERTRSQTRSEFGAMLGGTAVITRRLRDSSQQVTVVGEVPIDTAKKVAESIEPVIY